MGVPQASSTNPTRREGAVLGLADPETLRSVLGPAQHEGAEAEDVVAMAAEYNIHFLPPPPGRESALS